MLGAARFGDVLLHSLNIIKAARTTIIATKWHIDDSTYDKNSWSGYLMHSDAAKFFLDANNIRIIDSTVAVGTVSLAYFTGAPLLFPVLQATIAIGANAAGYRYEQNNFVVIDEAYKTRNGTCESLTGEQKAVIENIAQNGKADLHKWIAAENIVRPAADTILAIYNMDFTDPGNVMVSLASLVTKSIPGWWKSLIMYDVVAPKRMDGHIKKASEMLATCAAEQLAAELPQEAGSFLEDRDEL